MSKLRANSCSAACWSDRLLSSRCTKPDDCGGANIQAQVTIQTAIAQHSYLKPQSSIPVIEIDAWVELELGAHGCCSERSQASMPRPPLPLSLPLQEMSCLRTSAASDRGAANPVAYSFRGTTGVRKLGRPVAPMGAAVVPGRARSNPSCRRSHSPGSLVSLIGCRAARLLASPGWRAPGRQPASGIPLVLPRTRLQCVCAAISAA